MIFRQLHKSTRLLGHAKRFNSTQNQPKRSNSSLVVGAAIVSLPLFFYFTSPSEKAPKSVQRKKLHSDQKLDSLVEMGKETKPISNLDMQRKQTMKDVDDTHENQDDDPREKPLIHSKYVLIGSGTASFSAIKGIRQNDKTNEILMVTEENQLPYQKPPMSKELWQTGNKNLEFQDWSGNNASVFYKNPEWFEENLIRISTGKKVVGIDSNQKRILLNDGQEIQYEQLLIATGSKPNHLQFDIPSSNSMISTFRNLDDYTSLRKLAEHKKNVIIIGGGFLGSELAVGLTNIGNEVNQIFPEEGNLGLILPSYLSQFCKNEVEKLNVKVHSNALVKNLSTDQGKVIATLNNDKKIIGDHCIVCVGAKPDVELAKMSGLEIDINGGILVNSELSAKSNIFAAGDCISFFDKTLGRRRIEHYDHAVQSGYVAGLNMSGSNKSYDYQPMFWSDLGSNVSFEAVGKLSSKLETKSFWNVSEKEFDKGVVFYIDNSKIGSYLLI
eukprot:NODE_10_length_61504_cov_0.956502.p10 type:complete len:498 gc:universal NODE_10_length_61504_cov_0.956502:14454-15947(+)